MFTHTHTAMREHSERVRERKEVGAKSQLAAVRCGMVRALGERGSCDDRESSSARGLLKSSA